MPTPTSTRRVDSLVQRVDRIRRIRNLCELQRATYMLAAAGLLAATLVLVGALYGSLRLFAVVTWSTLAALAVTSTLLIREASRRWLARSSTVAWIEQRAGLGGRLRSLFELDARVDEDPAPFFLPLLRAENERALPRWTPERLAPERVPRIALTLALLSTFVLLAALTLTPVLYPRVPDLADARLAAARGAPSNATSTPGDDADSLAARLPGALQEQIRQTVWGRAWDRVRDALAEAERRREELARELPFAPPGSDEDADDQWQLAERPRTNDPERGHGGGASDSRVEAEAVPEAAQRTIERTNQVTGDETRTAAGAGAGTGSSPELYGAAAPADLASRARFELGLVTRMRLKDRHGEPDREAPTRAPDRRPLLAASDRREEFGHEMAIPRAYEPIVRQVFAHPATEAFE